MKQASFIINGIENKTTKVKTNIENNDKITIHETNTESKKNTTSKKPIKYVENIYYFR